MLTKQQQQCSYREKLKQAVKPFKDGCSEEGFQGDRSTEGSWVITGTSCL